MSGMCADRIKETINRRGLSVKAVAKDAGFSFQQFSDMLHGRKIIRADYLPSIAKALGVKVGDLFEDE